MQKELRKQQKEISQLKVENEALKNNKVENKIDLIVCESDINQLESNNENREYNHRREISQSDLLLRDIFCKKKTEICEEKPTNVPSEEQQTTLRGEI